MRGGGLDPGAEPDDRAARRAGARGPPGAQRLSAAGAADARPRSRPASTRASWWWSTDTDGGCCGARAAAASAGWPTGSASSAARRGPRATSAPTPSAPAWSSASRCTSAAPSTTWTPHRVELRCRPGARPVDRRDPRRRRRQRPAPRHAPMAEALVAAAPRRDGSRGARAAPRRARPAAGLRRAAGGPRGWARLVVDRPATSPRSREPRPDAVAARRLRPAAWLPAWAAQREPLPGGWLLRLEGREVAGRPPARSCSTSRRPPAAGPRAQPLVDPHPVPRHAEILLALLGAAPRAARRPSSPTTSSPTPPAWSRCAPRCRGCAGCWVGCWSRSPTGWRPDSPQRSVAIPVSALPRSSAPVVRRWRDRGAPPRTATIGPVINDSATARQNRHARRAACLPSSTWGRRGCGPAGRGRDS